MKKLLIIIGVTVGLNTSIVAGPIHEAVRVNNLDEVERLLKSGVDINETDGGNWTALHHAIERNRKLIFEFLIDKGADVNAISYEGGQLGDTPFKVALTYAHPENKLYYVVSLLSNGADVNFAHKLTGKTPLHYASLSDVESEVIRLLIIYDADLNAKNSGGQSPLHFAKSERIAEILLKNGASINAVDKLGRNALWQGNMVVVKYLLLKGADPNQEDIYGKLLADSREGEMLALLRKYGAKTTIELLTERIEKLEANVGGTSNPTDEWPRKMWEIDLGFEIQSIGDFYVGPQRKSFIVKLSLEGSSHNYWVSENGEFHELDSKLNVDLIMSDDVIFFDSKHLVFKDRSKNKLVTLSRLGKEVKRLESKTKFNFDHNKLLLSYSKDLNSSRSFLLEFDTSKVTGWDLTPPTIASTDQEGGNNGVNETANSRLIIKTAGPDIGLATDGKLGAAELQKSNDLRSWRKLGDVPAEAAEVLVTPREFGNEFYRLKKK
jgi:ankyrin repeat protein